MLHEIQGKFGIFKQTIESSSGTTIATTTKLGDTGGGKNINEEVIAQKDKRIKELEEELASLNSGIKSIY